jgi:hypothetical protein
VRRALQDLLAHLIAKPIRQSKRDNQRRHSHRNPEYRRNRRRPCKPPLPPRPQIPECKKHSYGIRIFNRDPVTALVGMHFLYLPADSPATNDSDSDGPAPRIAAIN